MQLSKDETHALALVALLLTLAAGVRVLGMPGGGAQVKGDALDLAQLTAASESAQTKSARRSKKLAPGEKIRVNKASAEELDRLPRVGKGLAERIVAERERGGDFQHPGDLERVSGLGKRSIELLAPHLDFFSTSPPLRRSASGSQAAPLASAKQKGAQAILDLNRANASELEGLPGVGPVLATRIVAYRDSVGRFQTVDELDRVSGVGRATLARLAPFLRVGQ